MDKDVRHKTGGRPPSSVAGVFVYVDLQGIPRLAGRLWTRLRKNRESATFEYVAAGL